MSTEATNRYIEALRRVASAASDPHAHVGCERAAKTMGLVHSLNDFRLFDSSSPTLLSPMRRGDRPTAARTFAGTCNDVFLFVGPPMASQPERRGILVFRADIEDTRMVATPWDSGGLHRRRAQHLSETERQTLIRNRTMPVPDYRRALATTFLLRFNGSAHKYLDSCISDSADPDDVYKAGEPASFTYEVRVPEQLDIQVKGLALVAIRREDTLNEGVRRFRKWCMESDVRFEVVDEHHTVRDVVVDFAKSLAGAS